MAIAAPPTATPPDTIEYYSNLLNQEFPGNLTGRNYTLAQAYVKYLEAHPKTDPAQAYWIVVDQLSVLVNTPGLIGQAGVSGITGAAGGAAAIPKALPSISPNNIPGFSGLNAIGNLANKLSEKNFWIRVGEGVVALILLDIGLKSLTGTSVIETTAKTAKKGAKTAALVAK